MNDSTIESLIAQGQAALDEGEIAQAQIVLLESYEKSEAAALELQQGISAFFLGKSGLAESDYLTAQRWFEVAWASLSTTSNAFWQATTLFELAGLARMNAQTQQSIDLYTQALNLYRESDRDDPYIQGVILYTLAEIAEEQEDYEQAQALYAASLQIDQQLEDLAGQRTSLFALGRVARYREDFTLARQAFEAVYEIDQAAGDSEDKALAIYFLGKVVFEQGDVPLAEQYLSDALAMQTTLGNDDGQGLIWYDLGQIAWQSGNLEQARIAFEHARQCFVVVNNTVGLDLMKDVFAALDQA